MSRFLKNRHYRIIATGLFYYMKSSKDPSVRRSAYQFLNQTGVSYTTDDVNRVVDAYNNSPLVLRSNDCSY